MEKNISTFLVAASIFLAAALFAACSNGDDVMSKKKGVYTVDTTTLAGDVKGYNAATPLKIQIKDDRIVSIEALENAETPGYFESLRKGGLLEKWNGMKVGDALKAEVDVVSGATYSSVAVIENVHRGLQYYKEHVSE